MLRFHVKITDNETGKELFEKDCNAIIGGFANEIGATEIADVDCSNALYVC